MKTLKIGKVNDWRTGKLTVLPRSGRLSTGVTLWVTTGKTATLVIEDSSCVTKDGEVKPQKVALAPFEQYEIQCKLVGGGYVDFEGDARYRTSYGRQEAVETDKPVFTRPPRERVRDPHQEMVKYQERINEERRKKAEFQAFNRQKEELANAAKEAAEQVALLKQLKADSDAAQAAQAAQGETPAE